MSTKNIYEFSSTTQSYLISSVLKYYWKFHIYALKSKFIQYIKQKDFLIILQVLSFKVGNWHAHIQICTNLKNIINNITTK